MEGDVLAPAAEAAVEDLDVMLNTNLRAPFFLAQKIVQPMIQRMQRMQQEIVAEIQAEKNKGG